MKIAIALVCLVLAAASAEAQYDPNNPYTWPPTVTPGGCTPYVPPGCAGGPGESITTYESEFDFPQVFVGAAGQENDYLTYVSLKNKAPYPSRNAVSITVTAEGSLPVTRSFVLEPNARLSIQLNEWPELQNLTGGVTVEVKMHRKGVAGIAMHSARDFWGRVTVLEGR